MAQITEKTVTVKVKTHPRDMYYPGKQTREHLAGIMQYMASKPVFPDPEKVEAFLKGVREGDVVGVEHNQYRATKVDNTELTGINIFTKREATLSVEDITMGLGSGYCEILYRDDKPYGIEHEKEVKVKVINHALNEDGTPIVPTTTTPTPKKKGKKNNAAPASNP